MRKILITNNNKAVKKYDGKIEVLYYDKSYLDILCEVRDKIHVKYKLLTHPMAGSLKPNQTPFKSVLIEQSDCMDMDGLILIENSIEAAKKFLSYKSLPCWPERILEDFKTVDLSLVDYSITSK